MFSRRGEVSRRNRVSCSGMSESSPIVVAVNISPGGVPKHQIEIGEVTSAGLVGDGHDHAKHNTQMQAISLIDVEDLDDLRREGFEV